MNLRLFKGLMVTVIAVMYACSGGGSSTQPELYLYVFGEVQEGEGRLLDGEVAHFNRTGGYIKVIIGNLGDAELVLENIEVSSLNDSMKIQPDPANLTFPKVVQPGEIDEVDSSPLVLQVYFNPSGEPDETVTTLSITTNDSHNGTGVYTFTLAPDEPAPEMLVSPSNYAFLNATQISPDSATFTLKNVGDAQMAIARVFLEKLTSETGFEIISPVPSRDMILEVQNSGMGGSSTDVKVQYRPVQVGGDTNNLVVWWGSKVDTDVQCATGGETCAESEKLCGNVTGVCPYTCINGLCACTDDDECRAAFCADPENCDMICLTGVCRNPQETKVALSGESLPGQLQVDFGDELITGCVDFTKVIIEGQSCTKIVNLTNAVVANGGQGGHVLVYKPTVEIEDDVDNPYSIVWYPYSSFDYQVDANGCVYDIVGTPISENSTVLSLSANTAYVAVTYTAPGAKGVNGNMLVNYSSPFSGTESVGLCGGVKKGHLDLAPPNDSKIVIYANPGEKKEKSFVIMNTGNEVLEINSITISKVWAEDPDPSAFQLIDAPTGTYNLNPAQLLPIGVEFDASSEQSPENIIVTIEYNNPILSEKSAQIYNVMRDIDFEGIELPVANPGTSDTYKDAMVGQTIVLDASASTPGSYEIPVNSGYTWFIYSKPPYSKVFTNQGGGPAKISVIPDVAGRYEFRLVVFSVDTQSSKAYFSDEVGVTIEVSN